MPYTAAHFKREKTERELLQKTFQRKDAIREFRKLDKFDQEASLWSRMPVMAIIGVPATAPERLVYHFLLKLQVFFQFQYPVPSDLEMLAGDFEYDITNYTPDFLIPDYKIWIEVHGSYWHLQPPTVESDNFKAAIVSMSSWKYVEWWDWEIERNLAFLFQRDCPELLKPDRATGLPAPYLLDIEEQERDAKALAARYKSQRMVKLWRERDPYYGPRRTVKIEAWKPHEPYYRPRFFKIRKRDKFEEV